MPVQWIAFVTFNFRRQFHPAILASVAVNVVAAIHCNDAQRFFLPLFWYDGSVAHGTAWRELLMKAADAVRGIVRVHRERYSVQASPAGRARETGRMICFPAGFQNPVFDVTSAHIAIVQRAFVAVFAEGLLIDAVKRPSD